MPLDGTTTLAEGQQALDRLLNELGTDVGDVNEAATRLQIIDRLLIECLGWPREEVEPEPHEDGEYADYELGKPRAAIWEVKRTGKAFDFPANPGKRIVADLRSVVSACPVAKKAVLQVQGYCTQRGTEIAVVSNGHQLIAFIATRSDGTPPLDGKCLVIDGFTQLQKNFIDVWQTLSPQAVAENRLKQLLRPRDERKIPQKLATLVESYPAFRAQTAQQKDLGIVAELLLIHIPEWAESEEQFYARCYSSNLELSKYTLVSKSLLETRRAALLGDDDASPAVVAVKPRSPSFIWTNEVQAEALSQRPVFLLGDVGVGKTAFLKRLMFVDAASEFGRAVYVYIDLATEAALAVDLRVYLLREVEQQLYQKYGIDLTDNSLVEGLYADELDRFERSIFGEFKKHDPQRFIQKRTEFLAEKLRARDEHIGRGVKHIAATTNRQVIVVLDNADQRSGDVQLEAFAIAHEITKIWGALVFAAMRPQTYLQLKKAAGVTSLSERVFSIQPPQIEDAIKRRLNFAIDIADGRVPIDKLKDTTFDLGKFSAVAKGLVVSLERPEIKRFYANCFGGDIVQAIQLTTKFFGNPHLNESRMIQVSTMRGGHHAVLLRDLWIATIFDKFEFYSAETSCALNLFDVWGDDPQEHFLLPIILAFLNRCGPDGGADGSMGLDAIALEMQEWGFNPAATRWALHRASTIDKPLLERVGTSGSKNSTTERYRATTVGAYYMSDWLASFEYLSAVWCDTPIFHDTVKITLRDTVKGRGFAKYVTRASTFRDYLTSVWKTAPFRPPYFDWVDHLAKGREGFASASAFVAQRTR